MSYTTRVVDRQDHDHNDANAALIALAPDLARIAIAAKELAEQTIKCAAYLNGMIEDGCPRCGGDCSSANPPVLSCPMKLFQDDLNETRAALAAFRAAAEGRNDG